MLSAPEQPSMPAVPGAPPPPPMFGEQKPGQKPKQKPAQPSFLGTATQLSAANRSDKTLLGQ